MAIEVGSVVQLMILISTVLGLIIAVPIMFLWNWLAPEIFSLPVISYWQAFGLYLFTRLLLTSITSSS